jgi:molecular chaperone IbpA
MNTTAHMAFGSHLNQFVGLERLLKDMEMSTSDYQLSTKYPPHNIIKYNDNEYVVELAVAGFSREELEITVEDCVLIMTGTKGEFDNEIEYLHKGISAKSFRKTIKLAETVIVKDAEFIDGILSVYLENIIPEHRKPKKILIGDGKQDVEMFLTE